MTEFDFTNQHPMSLHNPGELLIHLQEHLSWSRIHLDEYRHRYPGSVVDSALCEVRDRIRQALAYMEFGDIDHKEESHD
ncbi:MAG: hypothetical protein DDT36_01660 [Firmicutes bacterium]|nr:hypothetical protein [Bacillota bacterium]